MSICPICKTSFTKARPLQKVCGPLCAREHVNALQAKRLAEGRKEAKEKLKTMQTKPELLKLAQTAFNAFIRARDAGKPCICCGKPLGSEPNTFDAGHWRSVGSAPHMRFDENNVHGQTKHCNNYLAGNAVEYRKGLIERIGLEEVERIESDTTVRKWTNDDLREIAATYRAKTRAILKGQE